MSTYLGIDEITVRYGAVEVLSGISLAVDAGLNGQEEPHVDYPVGSR